MIVTDQHFEWNLERRREMAEEIARQFGLPIKEAEAVVPVEEGAPMFGQFGEDTPTTCDNCHRRLIVPFVRFEMPTGENISLHPGCAYNLALLTLRDALTAHFGEEAAKVMMSEWKKLG